MSHRHSKHGFRPTADSWNRFANARVCGPSRHELSLHYAVPHFGVTAHPTAVPADLEGASKNSCFRTPHGSPPSAESVSLRVLNPKDRPSRGRALKVDFPRTTVRTPDERPDLRGHIQRVCTDVLLKWRV